MHRVRCDSRQRSSRTRSRQPPANPALRQRGGWAAVPMPPARADGVGWLLPNVRPEPVRARRPDSARSGHRAPPNSAETWLPGPRGNGVRIVQFCARQGAGPVRFSKPAPCPPPPAGASRSCLPSALALPTLPELSNSPANGSSRAPPLLGRNPGPLYRSHGPRRRAGRTTCLRLAVIRGMGWRPPCRRFAAGGGRQSAGSGSRSSWRRRSGCRPRCARTRRRSAAGPGPGPGTSRPSPGRA